VDEFWIFLPKPVKDKLKKAGVLGDYMDESANPKNRMKELVRLKEQDQNMKADLMDFLKYNPNVSDDELHRWAKKKGYDIEKVEEFAYDIAGRHLRESFKEASIEEFERVLTQIATIAKKNNIQPYLVGGAVRDEIAGLPFLPDTDADLTGAEKDDGLQLAYLVARKKDLPNPKFYSGGTAMLIVSGVEVEFNGAKRLQHSVHKWLEKNGLKVNHWNSDVYGRDFTVNALYKDLFTGKILAPTGKGKRDIKNKIIRPVRDAESLFKEEPVRIIRAIRFKLKLNGEFSPDLEKAIKEFIPLLKNEVGHKGFNKQMNKVKKYSGWKDEFKRLGLMKYIDSIKEYVTPLPEVQARPNELKMGIEVELEHTDNREEAKRIALQHLAEVPDYYTKLKKYVEPKKEMVKMKNKLKELLRLKEQDDRPPKAWWDKCVAKAKGFADDPAKYCGWLWANGKTKKPELRKAFGEELADEKQEKDIDKLAKKIEESLRKRIKK